MVQFDEHIFKIGWFNHQPEDVLMFHEVFFVSAGDEYSNKILDSTLS